MWEALVYTPKPGRTLSFARSYYDLIEDCDCTDTREAEATKELYEDLDNVVVWIQGLGIYHVEKGKLTKQLQM